MELPPPGLHSDDGAEGGSVAKDRSHHVVRDRLGLQKAAEFTESQPDINYSTVS